MAIVVLRSKSDGSLIKIDTDRERMAHMRGRVVQWARLAERFNNSHKIVMVTLTYGKAKWKPDHISEFMDRYKRSAYRRGKKGKRIRSSSAFVSYAWVAELQPVSGKVHYHVLIILKRGYRLPKPDQSYWSHGFSDIRKARSVYYVVSYLKKQYHQWGQGGGYAGTHGGTEFPPHLRLFGIGSFRASDVLHPLEKFILRSSAWPKKVRESALSLLVESLEAAAWADPYDFIVRRQSGGWYLDFLAGSEFLPAAFEYVS